LVIAIMDTGIDTGHPDLAGKIWHNPGEIPGNGVDDDGNGLVDDIVGWDFGTNDADPNPEYTQDPGSGLDVGFHGTFCAGIAAAAPNNAEGMAGAAWRCRLMPLKVSHPDSGITTRAVTEAFLYAADKRPSVLSMSFGAPADSGVPEYFQALVDVATEAGVLCVAAAGNDGDSARTYPAACHDVVAVGASDESNGRASFSNWGPWVSVAAPGSSMVSAICRNYLLTDLDQIFYMLFFSWDGVTPYMYGDGTSFACPLAAGVCGLIRSRFPGLSPQQVKQHLIATGDLVAYDHSIGPEINAFRAVDTPPVAVTPAAPPRALQLDPPAPNPSTLAAALRFGLPADGHARVAVFDCSGRRVRVLIDGTLSAGPHLVYWDGRDAGGRAAPSGVYLVRLESGGAVTRQKLVRLAP
jgi:subtilisin family serine protease